MRLWTLAMLLVSGCSGPPAAFDDMSAATEGDMSEVVDFGEFDLALAADMRAMGFSFYPELQRQIEFYGCQVSGCHAAIQPVLVRGDTRDGKRNYDALLPFAGPDLVQRIRPGHHGGGVSAVDLSAWQLWVAAPVP